MIIVTAALFNYLLQLFWLNYKTIACYLTYLIIEKQVIFQNVVMSFLLVLLFGDLSCN